MIRKPKLGKLYKITDKVGVSTIGKFIYKDTDEKPYYLFELQNGTELKDSFLGELRNDIKNVDIKNRYIWNIFLTKLEPYNNSLKTWLKNGVK